MSIKSNNNQLLDAALSFAAKGWRAGATAGLSSSAVAATSSWILGSFQDGKPGRDFHDNVFSWV